MWLKYTMCGEAFTFRENGAAPNTTIQEDGKRREPLGHDSLRQLGPNHEHIQAS